MKGPKRGLGSGLGALLPSEPAGTGIRQVAVERITQNPRQPRTFFEPTALEELAASIREHGIIQPLIVSQDADGEYALIAGERRWRAAQLAGLSVVPVLVRESSPQQLLELALIENVQRADLNPLEEAQAYQALKDEFGLTDNEIADRVGKNSRVAVANARRLLELSEQAKEALMKQSITAGHGRAILKIEDSVQQQAALDAIIAEELGVREADRLGDLTKEFSGDVDRALAAIRRQRASRVGTQRQAAKAAAVASQEPSPNAADDNELSRTMERIIGTPVRVNRHGTRLQVVIDFHTDEKLQEFFDALNNARE